MIDLLISDKCVYILNGRVGLRESVSHNLLHEESLSYLCLSSVLITDCQQIRLLSSTAVYLFLFGGNSFNMHFTLRKTPEPMFIMA